MRKEKRLTRPQQYSLVYKRGGSWVSDLLVLRALPNGLAFSRYGLSVSKKVGGAVIRNRIKRRLREILEKVSTGRACDIVFVVRPAAVDADFSGLKESVEKLLERAGLLENSEDCCSPFKIKE